MEDCLTNIIKLSRTECDCFEENKPSDYNEGQSEIYLDELEGINLQMVGGASTNCDEDGIWNLMAWAREEAAKIFKADLLSCINANYTNRRPVFSGLLGQSTFNGNLSLSESKAGINVSFPQIKGGMMTVKRIGLAVNASSAITVDVYSNDPDQTTPIASYTINSTANTLTYATLSSPLELPMWSANVNRLEYYFVYSRVGFQPKNGKGDCGCGGTPPLWKNWVSVKGIRGNNTSYSTFSSDKYINGILLDVDFRCQTGRLICSDEEPLDFENDGWAMQIGYANRWKAGELLMQKMLDSPELNRYTMMDRERVYGMRNHARKTYNDFIAYLCDNKEISTGCLVCKPNPNFAMGEILA